ncbi:IPT/TIG domain-containing protein [Parachryseolinea silvisoli]|uniref:IPT/TIG domain-containing protein n=1 Tax=Parachryseolinea silvisoli TaxID=2873601 RepID=UPI002265BCB7|nr:IPT/TIG domain-containing protein [Parachryseolinea silvisoli]MCD9020175.1 IPT/TIG domain-containing protein [Parachryseolinea silvisoli]
MLLLVYYSCQEEENLPPLKIFSITPSEVQLGDTIEISGQGFSPGFDYNEITFTGGAVTYSLPGSTTEKILVEVPDGAQSGEMIVDILDVEMATAPSVEVHPPVIDEVTPVDAWVGDSLVIRGENFQRNAVRNHVKLGRVEAPTLRSSKTELTVLVPQGAENGPVSVMGVNGPQFTVKPSVIYRVVPTHGVVGDTIEIQGRGMNAQNIHFAPGIPATITLGGSGARTVRVVVPVGATDGPITIRNYINNTELILTTPQDFLIYPNIAEMTPLSGYAGIAVTLSGHNFSPVAEDNIVRFNGQQAVVTKATTNELLVTVPAGVTTGPVSITVNGRETPGPVFTATSEGTPIVLAMSPRSGSAGSRVQLDGINFGETASGNTVRFAGNATATIISASPTQLVVEVPPQAITGPVTVTKDGKTGVAPTYTINSVALPFLTAVSPASARPGTSITVKGGNFNAAAGLVLGAENNVRFTVSSVTATEFVATVPENLIPGDYSLFVIQGGRASNTIPFEVAGNPVLQSIDVTEGTPGTIVTITGTELHSKEVKNIVRFGTETAVLVNPGDVNPNTVAVYVPNVAAGVYNITLTAFGVTSNSLSFTVKPGGAPVRNILYTENAAPQFAVRRRTNDPPSESTLFERSSAVQPIYTLTLDLAGQKAYFADDVTGGPSAVARANYDQSGYQVLYSGEHGIGQVLDLSLDIAHQKVYITDYVNVLYRGDMDGSGALEMLYDFGSHGILPTGVSYEPEADALYIVSGYPDIAPFKVLRGAVDGSGLTDLFDEGDGLTYPIDVKVDVGSGQLFVLDGYNTIKAGNLDGSGGMTTLATRNREILGISLDTGDDFVYWMEFSNDAKTQASVFRQKYDGSAEVEEVYTNITQSELFVDPLNGGMRAGLVVEDAGGASARGGKFSSMKVNRISRQPVKRLGPIARPGK